MRAVVALVGVIVLAFLAAGCGSDKSSDSNPTTDWANGVCSAVTTYRQSVTDAANSLKSNVSQAGFKDATSQVQKATEHLRRQDQGPRQARDERGRAGEDDA